MSDWMPRWLGRHYSRLWNKFGTEPFPRKKIQEICPKNDLQIFSSLRKFGALTIFEVINRRRFYRLVNPSLYVESIASSLDFLPFSNSKYAILVGETALALQRSLGSKLTGLIIYGSVARRETHPTSDVDVLVVAEDLPNSLGSRIDSFLWIEEEEKVETELDWLITRGVQTQINIYPVALNELIRCYFLVPSIFSLKIILDPHNLLKLEINKLRIRLERAKMRILTDDSRMCYVDFGLSIGEEVILAD